MKTTLTRLCFYAIIFLVASCARKASIYSGTIIKNGLVQSSEDGFLEENDYNSNKQVMNFNSNFGSYTGARSSIESFNGVSASANVSVAILDPATISKTNDLVFEKISLKNLKNKFVSLNAIGANYQRIVIPNMYTNIAQSVAGFNISGGNNVALDIDFPKQITLYHKNGNDIISALLNAKENIEASGDLYNYKFAIDGKLYFNSLVNPGKYSSKDDFFVTVNYN